MTVFPDSLSSIALLAIYNCLEFPLSPSLPPSLPEPSLPPTLPELYYHHASAKPLDPNSPDLFSSPSSPSFTLHTNLSLPTLPPNQHIPLTPSIPPTPPRSHPARRAAQAGTVEPIIPSLQLRRTWNEQPDQDNCLCVDWNIWDPGDDLLRQADMAEVFARGRRRGRKRVVWRRKGTLRGLGGFCGAGFLLINLTLLGKS